MIEEELKNKQDTIDSYHEVINNFPQSKYAAKAKDRITELTGQK